MPGSDRVEYECLRCETVQSESKGIAQKGAIVRCRGCGAVTYRVTEKGDPMPKAKNCKHCGAKLRASNKGDTCSACWGKR